MTDYKKILAFLDEWGIDYNTGKYLDPDFPEDEHIWLNIEKTSLFFDLDG